jgi:AbrB family looped-hinge helix DNA binding protein
MYALETTITSKGQVTIPVEVRKALKLKPKDKVLFELEGGIAKITPVPSKLIAGFGAVSAKSRPEEFSRLRARFEKDVADEVLNEK